MAGLGQEFTLRGAVVLVVSAVLLAVSPGAVKAGDPRLGEVLFRSHCEICHSVDLPQNVFGPHLVGVFGREAGTVAGYRYSYEMRVSGIVWEEETLDALMVDPQKLIPGTIMYFRGLPSADDRAHIIAYLKQRSGVE